MREVERWMTASRGGRRRGDLRARTVEAQTMTPRVAITGIGLVTALGATREESWRRMTRGRMRDRSRRRCSTPRAIAAASPPRCRWTTSTRRSRALERRRLSRGDRIGVHAAAEAIDDAGLLDGGVDRRADRHFPRRRHRRPAAQRAVLSDLDDRGHRAGAAVGRVESFPQHAGRRRSPSASASKGRVDAWSRPARRARLRSAARADAIRQGRADAVLAGGTDALARLTFSGFNQLKLMDPAPCRPFDRSRAGMSIGEGAGILVLEDLDRAAPARRHDLRRARRLRARLRGAIIRRRRSRRGGRSRP